MHAVKFNQVERIRFDQPVAFRNNDDLIGVREVARTNNFTLIIYRAQTELPPILFTGEKVDQLFRGFLHKRLQQLKKRAGVAA